LREIHPLCPRTRIGAEHAKPDRIDVELVARIVDHVLEPQSDKRGRHKGREAPRKSTKIGVEGPMKQQQIVAQTARRHNGASVTVSVTGGRTNRLLADTRRFSRVRRCHTARPMSGE